MFVFIISGLLFAVSKLDNGSSKRCFEHARKKTNCIECLERLNSQWIVIKAELEMGDHIFTGLSEDMSGGER